MNHGLPLHADEGIVPGRAAKGGRNAIAGDRRRGATRGRNASVNGAVVAVITTQRRPTATPPGLAGVDLRTRVIIVARCAVSLIGRSAEGPPPVVGEQTASSH